MTDRSDARRMRDKASDAMDKHDPGRVARRQDAEVTRELADAERESSDREVDARPPSEPGTT